MYSHEIDYSKLPEHMQPGMRRYIELGIPPGSFLRAVLENKLVESFQYADDINLHRMFDFASFLYNEINRGCYGNEDTVEEWINDHTIIRGLCVMIMGWDGYREANKKSFG